MPNHSTKKRLSSVAIRSEQPKTELSDLLARSRAGDQRATHALFGKIRANLRRIARGRLAGRAPLSQASDLAQEASVKLFLHLEEVRGNSDLELLAYARTILERVLLDQGKAERCQKRDARDPAAQHGLRAGLEERRHQVTEELRAKERHHALWALLPKLPWAQRRALIMRFGGCSLREIAAALGQDHDDAAANTLWRATRRLRALLGSDAGDEPAGSDLDPRALSAFRQYLYAVERGAAPEREAFLASHPEVAELVRAMLQGLDQAVAILHEIIDAENDEPR